MFDTLRGFALNNVQNIYALYGVNPIYRNTGGDGCNRIQKEPTDVID